MHLSRTQAVSIGLAFLMAVPATAQIGSRRRRLFPPLRSTKTSPRPGPPTSSRPALTGAAED